MRAVALSGRIEPELQDATGGATTADVARGAPARAIIGSPFTNGADFSLNTAAGAGAASLSQRGFSVLDVTKIVDCVAYSNTWSGAETVE